MANVFSSLSKFLTTERLIIAVVLAILAYALYMYSDTKTLVVDGLETAAQRTPSVTLEQPDIPEEEVPVSQSGSYSSQSVASPQDLLPQDQNSQWASLNPAGQGNIAAPDLLQAGYHIGLDTIGQTLRNANLQERSDPIIPKSMVGPWNQSTIEPDLGRVPLEVGVGAR
jgi:hypothetical protein